MKNTMKNEQQNATHTPGPWIARQIGGSVISIEKTENGIRSVIAETHYMKLAEEHGGGYSSNAHLIAAAPDLLAALKRALVAVEYYHAREGAEYLAADCVAAIAKAEGRA